MATSAPPLPTHFSFPEEKLDMDEVLDTGMLENENEDFSAITKAEEANILNNFIEMIDEKLPEMKPRKSSKRKRKHKHRKDPNKPKRSMGAFIFFANEKRQQLRDLNPGLKITEITTRLAEMWKKLPDIEKQPYLLMSDRDKHRFKQEMSRYIPPSESSSDSSDTERKKKKKKKKKKHSRKPKRPMSSFIFFANDKRALVRDKFPDLKVTDITKTLAEMWKKLTDEDKKQYLDLGERDKERFKQANIEYVASDVSSDSSSDSDQTPKKKKDRKKKKAKRDPNKPKRPMSAFLHFANDQRQALRDKNPNVPIPQITKTLAEMWKQMTEEEKKPYQLIAERDKERFRDETIRYAVPSDSSSDSSGSDSSTSDASSDSEPSSKKRKISHRKKRKDPLKPKRPMSAFLHFTNAKRQRVKDKHPEFKVTEIVKKLAKIWRKMPEEKKKKYAKLAERDKDRYKQDISNYVPPGSSSGSSCSSSDSDSE